MSASKPPTPITPIPGIANEAKPIPAIAPIGTPATAPSFGISDQLGVGVVLERYGVVTADGEPQVLTAQTERTKFLDGLDSMRTIHEHGRQVVMLVVRPDVVASQAELISSTGVLIHCSSPVLRTRGRRRTAGTGVTSTTFWNLALASSVDTPVDTITGRRGAVRRSARSESPVGGLEGVEHPHDLVEVAAHRLRVGEHQACRVGAMHTARTPPRVPRSLLSGSTMNTDRTVDVSPSPGWIMSSLGDLAVGVGDDREVERCTGHLADVRGPGMVIPSTGSIDSAIGLVLRLANSLCSAAVRPSSIVSDPVSRRRYRHRRR